MTQSPTFADVAYVLLVGTSANFNQKIGVDLAEVGYQTVAIDNPEQGLQRISQAQPGMVVVDYNALGQKGIDFCRQLRDDSRVFPIIFLVARDRVQERVICLEAGADDYLLQPYQQDKLAQIFYVLLLSKHSIFLNEPMPHQAIAVPHLATENKWKN